MTVYARLVLEAIGVGFRLRVPHDGGRAMLVCSYPELPKREDIGPLEAAPVRELLQSGILHKLTKGRDGNRYGWAELGLDGTDADLYAMTQ